MENNLTEELSEIGFQLKRIADILDSQETKSGESTQCRDSSKLTDSSPDNPMKDLIDKDYNPNNWEVS